MSFKSLVVLIAGSGLFIAQAARAQSDDKPPAGPAEQPSGRPAIESAEQRSEQLTPPIALPTRETVSPTPVNPWFLRPPLALTAGATSQWKLTIYGFAEADMMGDSTRSFNDGLNDNVIAHNQTQAGDNTRLQFTIRNSRLGFNAEAPTIGGIRSSGVLEFDLFGNQPNINSGGGSSGQAPGPGDTTEAAYFNNAAPRIRHAYVKLENAIADILVGQTYHLLGWQNYFFGASCAFLGLPNELFNRTVQLRLTHTFATNAVNLDVAAAAFRPAERDSGLPDGEGGLRLAFNHWKAMTTPGSGGTGALPAAIGVSGLVRSFRVNPYAPLPAPPIPLTGWAIAANILIPIIPVTDSTDRGNALTVTGEFVTGTGDADQYTGMTAGATMPNVYPLPPDTPVNASGTATPQAGSAPLVGAPYTPDVDPGLVAFDTNGILHTINWQTFIVGVQYYLPPTGRVFITGNYSRGNSNNIASLFHPDSPTQPWVNAGAVFQSSWYVDGNIFFDITPAARVGLSYQRVTQAMADGTNAYNNRFEMTWLYFF
ncbi:MAG: hypothetical protein ABSC94_00555 [Polyangiaceae bacterium]|jgi:hypothetical protein